MDSSVRDPDLRRQRLMVLALQLTALVLLALHLYVRMLPATAGALPAPGEAESLWWGLWPVTFLPAWVVWVGVAAILGALLWGVYGAFFAPTALEPTQPARVWPFFALVLLLAVSFYVFPIVHTRWGDAYVLANGIARPDPALRITHSWQAPLDVFLHSRVWLAVGPWVGWEDATPVYRLLSPLAGLVYLGAALGAAQTLRPSRPWLLYGLLATLGLMQLFFGYVENYSFAAAGVLLYLWLALETLQGRRPLWVAATVLALTHALHPSTIVLAPSLVVLGWLLLRNKSRPVDVLLRAGAPISPGKVAAQIVLPMLVVGVAVFVWMEASGHGLNALLVSDRPGGADARWLVPLWGAATRWERYTMFSWAHLREWLNGQLLVAPVVLPSLFAAVALGWKNLRRTADGSLFSLGTASAFYLLFTWVWNPDYGGQRDWDLFSLATIPLTLLTAAVLARTLPNRRLLWAGMFPLLLFQALHTAAWIYSNTLPWQWPA